MIYEVDNTLQNSFMQLKELFTRFLVSAFVVSLQDNPMKKTCQNRQIDVWLLLACYREFYGGATA